MAKVTGQSSDLSGKVGNLTYAQTKYGTVVYPSKRKAKIPRRSEKQMYIRTQWANLAAVYRQFNKTLKKAFEGLGDTMSVYNAFIQANTNVVKVYVPKSVRLNGGSVLAPYIITRGTLPSVVTTVNGSGVMVTDINLGNLVIGAQTTVQQLAAAVVSYNSDYQAGDQITFFYGQQTVDQVTGVPRAKITGYKVMLDLTDTTPLWDVVGELGFTSVQGSGVTVNGYVLGMSQGITDGACAWIHSREDASGNLNVSTQYLYVDSTVLSTYQGDNAFASSADSYGGINTEAVYLQPTDLTNQILAAAGLIDGSGFTGNGSGSETTGNETGGDSGSSSSGNGNENGGSGGSESTETGGGTSGETTGNETGDDNTGGSGSGSDNTGGGGDNTGGGGDDEPGGDDH